MTKILNLTQHVGTADQIAQGLFEPDPESKNCIQLALTFTGSYLDSSKFDSKDVLTSRAAQLASIASDLADFGISHVLIGGLPALMGPLEVALRAKSLIPVFSHSDRVSEDQAQPDGSVKKVMVFKHQFFYEGAL